MSDRRRPIGATQAEAAEIHRLVAAELDRLAVRLGHVEELAHVHPSDIRREVAGEARRWAARTEAELEGHGIDDEWRPRLAGGTSPGVPVVGDLAGLGDGALQVVLAQAATELTARGFEVTFNLSLPRTVPNGLPKGER